MTAILFRFYFTAEDEKIQWKNIESKAFLERFIGYKNISTIYKTTTLDEISMKIDNQKIKMREIYSTESFLEL